MEDNWIDIPISKLRKTFVTGRIVLKCKSLNINANSDFDFQKSYIIDKVLFARFVLAEDFSYLKENTKSLKKSHSKAELECKLKLPENIIAELDTDGSKYSVTLNEPKFLADPKVFNITIEDNRSYATYEGEIAAYLLDTVVEYKRVLVLPEVQETFLIEIDNGGDVNEQIIINDEQKSTPAKFEVTEGEYTLRLASKQYESGGRSYTFSKWSDGSVLSNRTIKIDSDTQLKAIYTDTTNAQNDLKTGSRHQGGAFNAAGCLSSIGTIISVIFGVFILASLLRAGGAGVLIFLAIIAVIYFIATNTGLIARAISSIFRVLGAVLIGILILGLLFNLLNTKENYRNKQIESESEKETQQIVELESDQAMESSKTFDTIVVQHREWSDYSGNLYNTELKIRKSDIQMAATYRNNQPSVGTLTGYSQVYVNLLNRPSLEGSFDLIYNNLDTIRVNRQLNDIQFAEMVVSMVQDIPYILVLPSECDYRQYADAFIRDYLRNNNPCVPYIKNGIFAPEEFLSVLRGDCDTRTLTLFKILAHYDYDVRIINSEELGHSILGVSLEGLQGRSFIFAGKQYFLWETTESNLKAGAYTPFITNQNQWQTALYINYD